MNLQDLKNTMGEMGLLYRIAGLTLQVIYDPLACKDVQVKVKRTWRERLFTRPWQPWKSYRRETKKEPAIFVLRQFSFLGTYQRVVVAHPSFQSQIAEMFREKQR